MFNVRMIEEIVLPLFKGRDLSIDITMKEFFEYTKIDLHFFSVDINTFQIIHFSHTSHPEWRIVDALYCSCCLPILMQPLIREGICYSDGGILLNYPVEQCVECGADPDEIFGICRKPILQLQCNINEQSTLIDYLLNIFYKTIERVLNIRKPTKIANEIYVDCPPLSVNNIFDTVSSEEERIRLIQVGVDAWLKQ